MSEADLLCCNRSLFAWLDSHTLHNLLWIIKVLIRGWMEQATHLCVCQLSMEFKQVKSKSKCIHHGDLTVIQQPVISC